MTEQPILQNSCGTCAVCCHALGFNAQEGYSKKAGEWCKHCTGTGCGIYETRYKLCQLYLCGWRKLPQLGEEWRPDRSGVLLMEIEGDEIHKDYRQTSAGLEFTILTGETAIRRPGFAEYIATLVRRRVAVYLSLIGRPKTVINPFLEDHVAAGDMPGLTRMLVHLFRLHEEAQRQGITVESVQGAD